MLEKFKLFFEALNQEDKDEAIRYILNSQNIKSLNEGIYTGPSKTIEKGLYTGPSSSIEKCRLCGK
jgi:hypothetical protein